MQTVLFHNTIFGPIHSRRLGTSLGINLMPNDGKICSFDCLYCEAGYNAQGAGTSGLPTRRQVAEQLEAKLSAMKAAGAPLDVITFSGNGEPTLHPDFGGVIDDTIALRDRYYPEVKISVLSNATRLGRTAVAEALAKVDNNILKLDSAIPDTVRILDRPAPGYSLERVIEQIGSFGGSAIVQTMICSGEHDGMAIDNSTDDEVDALIEAYRRIAPREVMIYTIDRPTPETQLRKVARRRLDEIAERIRHATGLTVQVSG
ncbi:MAG: radical SAM protein [Muribaculaceae bacterium]|nr:radical SAM protein [Muribaculaceae bacterium]